MEPALPLNTSVLLTLTIILTPTLLPLMAKHFHNSPATITHTVKTAFLTSPVPMTLFMYSGLEHTVSHLEWKLITNFKIPLSFKMDQYSLMLTAALMSNASVCLCKLMSMEKVKTHWNASQ